MENNINKNDFKYFRCILEVSKYKSNGVKVIYPLEGVVNSLKYNNEFKIWEFIEYKIVNSSLHIGYIYYNFINGESVIYDKNKNKYNGELKLDGEPCPVDDIFKSGDTTIKTVSKND